MKNYISNVNLTNYYPDRLTITHINTIQKDNNIISMLIALYGKYDGVIILNPSFNWAWRCMVIKIFFLGKKRIVFFDMLLSKPRLARDYLKAYIKRFVLKFVDKFIFLHKDISGYNKYFGIKKSKCVYIPFKANNIDKIEEYQIVDNGYLLSCGASHRDYILLANSLKLYPCETKIVLPEPQLAEYNNSIIDETLFNEKVNIVRHDFKPQTWYKIMAGCRAVVLPIRYDAIQCAGISVYLEAMAFGKPVIITEGSATKGLLTEETAAICPPNDPVALSEAIKRVMEDKNYRIRLSAKGSEYVKSLGGVERLVRDILKVLI